MRMEEYVRIVAGVLVLIFVILSAAHSRFWLLFAALVGINSDPVGLYPLVHDRKNPRKIRDPAVLSIR